jgi:hypothetical protein
MLGNAIRLSDDIYWHDGTGRVAARLPTYMKKHRLHTDWIWMAEALIDVATRANVCANGMNVNVVDAVCYEAILTCEEAKQVSLKCAISLCEEDSEGYLTISDKGKAGFSKFFNPRNKDPSDIDKDTADYLRQLMDKAASMSDIHFRLDQRTSDIQTSSDRTEGRLSMLKEATEVSRVFEWLFLCGIRAMLSKMSSTFAGYLLPPR